MSDRPELRMEAVFILTELGHSPFVPATSSTALSPILASKEMSCAKPLSGRSARPGLSATKMSSPSSTMPTRTSPCTPSALFGADTPRPVIECLVQDLIASDPRRAPAASEVLRIIASDEVLRALVTAADAGQPVPDWIVATLGRLPSDGVRAALQGSPLLDRIAPMLLTAQGAHWLASENHRHRYCLSPEAEHLLTPGILPRSDGPQGPVFGWFHH